MSQIISRTEKKVGIITLNNIENQNSVSANMLEEIANQIRLYEKDDNIKAIIISGDNKFFASGIEIQNLINEKTIAKMQQKFEVLDNCTKPLIAAVSGNVLGIGFEIALACDIVLASENSVFAFPETSLDFIPCFGGIQRIISTIGKAKAMEMIMTNRAMKAAEAERTGIISRIVPSSELEDESIKVASKVAEVSESCIKLIKESLKNGVENLDMRVSLDKRTSRIRFLDLDFLQTLIK